MSLARPAPKAISAQTAHAAGAVGADLGAPVRIDDLCTGCGACITTCPESALAPGAGRVLIVAGRCNLCSECIEICPSGAISETRRSLPMTIRRERDVRPSHTRRSA